jgi:apolipoprotein N-acyltransferase
MNRILQVFCAFFSGLILSLAIPNEIFSFGSPVAGLISLIPLYIAIAYAKSYRDAFLLNGIQALTVHLFSSFWLANFRDFAIFTLGASALGTAFIAAVFGCVLYVPFTWRNTLWENGAEKSWACPVRTIWFALSWTLWEWAKSSGFLGYPWGTLSMSAYSFKPIIQIADITGAYGISFLFAFFAAVCAEGLLLTDMLAHAVKTPALFTSYRNTAACLCMLFFISFLYGVYQFDRRRIPEKFLNTVLVQQNLDPWASADDNKAIEISETLSESGITDFLRAGIKPDLVLWSEAVLRYPFPAAEDHYSLYPEKEPLVSFINRLHVPFIIGAPYTFNREKQLYGNAAVLFDENGKYRGAFNKIHLVPFAEAIPGTEYEWVLKFMDSIVGFSSGWKAGEQYVLFDVPAHKNPDVPDPLVNIISLDNDVSSAPQTMVRISTPICFEDAFPSVCRGLFFAGSEVFINLTDDSWSLTKSAEYQHFVIAALRAIEYRTTLVRSTNSGYSVVVDPSGKVLADLPLFRETAMAYAVPVYKRNITVYARFGNWLPYAALLLLLSCLLSVELKSRKRYC